MGWFKGLAGRVADNLIATLIAAGMLSAAFLGWFSGAFGAVIDGDASLPGWTMVVGVMATFLGGAFAGFRINRRREVGPALLEAHRFWREAELHAEYAAHVAVTLSQLQNVIAGDVSGVSLEDFIERGVLHPGRDMLIRNQAPGADVRISILVRDGEDFVMAYSAGHSPAGHAAFRMRIADSFSRHAFEQGAVVTSSDLRYDPRFRPHPRATREYRSIVCVPLRSGGVVAGVFNVVFSAEAACDVSDSTYAVSLAEIAKVALVAIERPRPDPSGGACKVGRDFRQGGCV